MAEAICDYPIKKIVEENKFFACRVDGHLAKSRKRMGCTTEMRKKCAELYGSAQIGSLQPTPLSGDSENLRVDTYFSGNPNPNENLRRRLEDIIDSDLLN